MSWVCQLIFLAILGSILSQRVDAFDLGVGLAAVDSMDDRAEPAASGRVGWTKGIYSQIYYWGKDFGPVSERNLVVTAAGETNIVGAPFLIAHYGIAASEHRVNLYDNIESRANPDPPSAEHDRDYNLGGVLGLGAQVRAGDMWVAFNWDSHIFLPGSPAIIFLASARKQTISLMLGRDL